MSTIDPNADLDTFDTGGLFSDDHDGGNYEGVQQQDATPAVPAPAPAGAPAPGAPAPAPAAVPPIDPSAVREVRLATGHVLRGTADQIIQQQNDIIGRQSHLLQPTYQPAADRQPTREPAGRSGGNGNRGYQSDNTGAPVQRPQAWSDEEFFKTMAKDPRAALTQYLQDYFDTDDPRSMVDTSYSVATQVSDRIAVADFMTSNPDFPASNESAALVIKRLEADKADLTALNLEVAYRQLVREGTLAPLSQQGGGQDYRQAYQAPPVQPQSRGAAAPPATPTSHVNVDRSMMRLDRPEFDTLSLAEQRAYITGHTIPDRFFK